MDQRFPLALHGQAPADHHEALDRFLNHVGNSGIDLYPSQEEAILELYGGANVILNTPTGSGKSLVATALHYYSVHLGRKSIYTSPVKALVNEKFLALCNDFGPNLVGMVTGDGSVNRKAPILCCTAEILANIGLGEGQRAVVHDIIMDEFHYYSDRGRGVAWQIPLLTLPQCRFLLMSATLGDTAFFEKSLSDLNHRPTVLVSSQDRPVPLKFSYVETPINETVGDLCKAEKAPIYMVNFTQREAAQNAQSFLSVDFCTKEEKAALKEAVRGFEFTTPYGKEIKKYALHGIGLHHAGLLPKYRVLVEKLAQQGLLKLICGTDTLGVGVNVPIRTVLFTQLCKFDGEKTGLLTVREFHQIAGRAGRKGFDSMGWVVCQAPAHVIENLKQERKAKLQPKKKFVKAKPPSKGYVHFDAQIFERLSESPPEPLASRFKVSHALMLQVLGRPENGCRAMKRLLRDCHESERARPYLIKQAMQLFRSLVEKQIVEFIPEEERINTPIRVNIDLQKDFSLTQTLSLYLLDTLPRLDPMDEAYGVHVLSLVESIVENPQVILRRQLDRIKREHLTAMKAEGMDYEDRIEELEKLEHPKPLADFIYDSFNRFSDKHPWIGSENIQPKAIAREMFEDYFSFNEYVDHYGLQRSEGVLLRYLASVHKVLTQTVPDHVKNDAVDDMAVYIEQTIKGVDSSIVEEWKRLSDPSYQVPTSQPADDSEEKERLARSERHFVVAIRNHVFQIVRALAYRRYEVLRSLVTEPDSKLLADDHLDDILDRYFSDRQLIRTDTPARAPHFTLLERDGDDWMVTQTLVDDQEHNDWSIHLRILSKPSLDDGKIHCQWVALGEIGVGAG